MFASRLVMAGVDIRTVAQPMGHSTIQMTMGYSPPGPGAHSGSGGDYIGDRQKVPKKTNLRK
jgi:integrase